MVFSLYLPFLSFGNVQEQPGKTRKLLGFMPSVFNYDLKTREKEILGGDFKAQGTWLHQRSYKSRSSSISLSRVTATVLGAGPAQLPVECGTVPKCHPSSSSPRHLVLAPALLFSPSLFQSLLSVCTGWSLHGADKKSDA